MFKSVVNFQNRRKTENITAARKRRNNDLQNTTQKTKKRSDDRWCERMSSVWSICDTVFNYIQNYLTRAFYYDILIRYAVLFLFAAALDNIVRNCLVTGEQEETIQLDKDRSNGSLLISYLHCIIIIIDNIHNAVLDNFCAKPTTVNTTIKQNIRTWFDTGNLEWS
jgi:hypothetical protein